MMKKKLNLEENIQIALKTGGIDLEDAIDIREVKNLTLANQLLKQRRQQKQAAEQQMKLAANTTTSSITSRSS